LEDPVRITPPGNPNPDGPFRASGTYLGEAFTGKTHNMCTWHTKDGVVLLVAFDPDTGTAKSMPNTVVVEVESWREFTEDVMPYVRARELDKLLRDKAKLDAKVDTLSIDTISIGSKRCFNEILGTREQSDRKDFGLLLNRLTSATMECMDTTRQYQEGQVTYNVLFGSHLVSPVAESAKIRVTPAIHGQFKDILPTLGGFSFICKQFTKDGPIKNGVPTKERGFYIHTVPPSDAYICGDRIGGEGKVYKALAPTTGGTYHELMDAWGVPTEKWQ
jgi:hypothetical protein